jgi:predicted dehydrogenase/NADPH:quinone reductase-like Zn-dependent oxidoreductase
MKQIIQSIKNGQMEIADVPAPTVQPGTILIRTVNSLISAGTERMLIDFGRSNIVSKVLSQPEKVRQVLDKIKTDGIIPTFEAVTNKLDEPLSLGYCDAGVVIKTGNLIHDIKPGDRVISNGPHAEVVCVPRNLCAKIPDGVSFEQAVFTVLGSIALQGIRLAVPEFGEKFMVFGMGLIGLLTVQLLKANGCEVIAVDINEKRLKLAEQFGAAIVNVAKGNNPIDCANAATGGHGVDGVLITASASKDKIVHQAAQSCRKRGRIVLVGVVDLNLQRNDFYKKEITFQVSCSYGAGRYDEKYEQANQDYPYGFVRWTEQRNFEAVLAAIKSGQLNVDNLITDFFELENASFAYEKIRNDPESLGIIITYQKNTEMSQTIKISQKQEEIPADAAIVGVIGAGNFAKGILLPSLASSGANIAYIADLDGAAARHAAKKFGAYNVTTDYKQILEDEKVRVVFIVVGHHLHARFVCEALQAGKHVFVEKPLAINNTELNQVIEMAEKSPDQIVMVGFNRRFSPHINKIKELLHGRLEPLCMNMTINAGFIPPDSWIQDPDRGGGRIIGEACHFIDLLSYLTDSPVEKVSAMNVNGNTSISSDKMSIILSFRDGSIGTINYFANGSKSYPKEMLEIFSEGRVIRMENYKITKGYGLRNFRKFRTLRQDKGHKSEIYSFINNIIKGGRPLIPFEQIVNVTNATFAAVESANTNQTIILEQQEIPKQKWLQSNPSLNSHQRFITCEAAR